MPLYYWSDIESIPAEPGIYAWYYVLQLTDHDVDQTIERIRKIRADDGEQAAAEVVQEFLDDSVFRYFAEGPYRALLRGALKPKYEGELRHTPDPSGTLVSRIVNAPERLRVLRQVLSKAVPEFSSPIYIGMSGNLKERLSTHKKLISDFREQSPAYGPKRDRDFARRVVSRNLVPTRLRVAVAVVPAGESQYVDAENVLNRINFPILGRN